MRKNARIYALRLLAISNRGSQEVLKRLLEKGYTEDIARDVVRDLEQNRILDDAKLSRETVRWAVQGKRIGRLRLRMELGRRGIKGEALENALDDYTMDEEHSLAVALGRERWEKLAGIEGRLRKKRVYDYLVRRGFNFEISRDVLETIENATNENRSDPTAIS